jgi:cell wall-associated NlpC family hydrolase
VILLRRLRPVMLAAMLVAGHRADAAAQQSGFSQDEKPFATISRMLLTPPVRDSLVDLARQQVGLRYKLGAKTPGKAFDCSGLVQWVLGKFEVVVPRTSREQVKQGIEVAKDSASLLPGDLLFFGKGTRVSHVGIYVGDGKYVQAANRREGVIESKLPTGRAATSWWKTVRRLFVHDSTAAKAAPDSTAAVVAASSS